MPRGRGAPATAGKVPGLLLLFVHKVAAPVLLPARLVRFGAERFFFAVADGLDAIAADPGLYERILDRVGAIGAESEVVFGRTPLVAVPLDGEADVRVLLEELRVALDRRLLVRPNIAFVVIEVDILHILAEQLLIGG